MAASLTLRLLTGSTLKANMYCCSPLMPLNISRRKAWCWRSENWYSETHGSASGSASGAMCAILCWALGYVLPPGWALFGALAAALQFGVFGLWMNSYFGGAVARQRGCDCTGFPGANAARGVRHSRRPRCARSGVILLFASRPV